MVLKLFKEKLANMSLPVSTSEATRAGKLAMENLFNAVMSFEDQDVNFSEEVEELYESSYKTKTLIPCLRISTKDRVEVFPMSTCVKCWNSKTSILGSNLKA